MGSLVFLICITLCSSPGGADEVPDTLHATLLQQTLIENGILLMGSAPIWEIGDSQSQLDIRPSLRRLERCINENAVVSSAVTDVCQLSCDWCDPSSLGWYGKTHDHNVCNWLRRQKSAAWTGWNGYGKSSKWCPVPRLVGDAKRCIMWHEFGSDSTVAAVVVSVLSYRNSSLNILMSVRSLHIYSCDFVMDAELDPKSLYFFKSNSKFFISLKKKKREKKKNP